MKNIFLNFYRDFSVITFLLLQEQFQDNLGKFRVRVCEQERVLLLSKAQYYPLYLPHQYTLGLYDAVHIERHCPYFYF